MYAGSRLVHLPMLALEPRFFRKSSSNPCGGSKLRFWLRARPCSIRLATNRSRDVPHLIGWALRLGPHHLSTTPSSQKSLLPMVVASKCSHLAMSSPRCGSSCREVIWRWALPFGPSSHLAMRSSCEDLTRDERHPYGQTSITLRQPLFTVS